MTWCLRHSTCSIEVPCITTTVACVMLIEARQYIAWILVMSFQMVQCYDNIVFNGKIYIACQDFKRRRRREKKEEKKKDSRNSHHGVSPQKRLHLSFLSLSCNNQWEDVSTSTSLHAACLHCTWGFIIKVCHKKDISVLPQGHKGIFLGHTSCFIL